MYGNWKITLRPREAHVTRNTDIGKMDPYLNISVGNYKFKTKTHWYGGKHPKWNDSFNFNYNG